MDKKQITIGLMLVLLILAFGGCTDMNVDELTQFSISKFEVKPTVINAGETANLSWLIMSAQTVSIDNGIGSVSNTGTRVIQPSKTTTYILTASNKTKTITATTQIIVHENSDGEDSEANEGETPSLQLVKNDVDDTLMVASADPGVLLWSDFEITGDCDNSGLETNVIAGDTITDCSGTIMIRHIPTNTLIGTWDFN